MILFIKVVQKFHLFFHQDYSNAEDLEQMDRKILEEIEKARQLNNAAPKRVNSPTAKTVGSKKAAKSNADVERQTFVRNVRKCYSEYIISPSSSPHSPN